MSKDYLRKNLLFHTKDKKDMELYNKLTALPHGEFSRRTKEKWHEYLRRENDERRMER